MPEPAVTQASPRQAAQPELAADSRKAWSDRLPQPWLFPLLAFAASWVVILVTWRVSDAIHGQSHPWTWHFVFKDAGWFLLVAQHGYPAHLAHGKSPFSATAFFPVFPALIRIAGRILGSYIIGGLIVTVAAGAASAVLVWLVAQKVRSRRVADAAVLLYCLGPGAMAFGMMYSEGTTVTLAAGAILALASRRWLIAGILCAIGTAEASIMFVLAGVAGLTALHAIWTRRDWLALIAPVLSPLGVLAFFGYLGHRYSDYRFWFQAEQSGWGEHVDFGRNTLHFLILDFPKFPQYNHTAVLVINVIILVMLIFTVVAMVLTITARLPLPVTLFGVLLPASFLLSPAEPRPRYVLCAFPLFIGLAAKLPRFLYWPLLAVSVLGLAFVTNWWAYHYTGPNL